MRGRKPKPTRQKVLEGNPGKRAINRDEPHLPDPGLAFDEPPLELGKDLLAIEEWRRLAPILRQSRAVTDADRGALLALCQQWARYLDAMQRITPAQLVVRSPSGYPMPNPYIGIANKSLALCLKLWPELGLTPSSRTRVRVPDNPQDNFTEFDTPLPPLTGLPS